jgi:hypothetical protein
LAAAATPSSDMAGGAYAQFRWSLTSRCEGYLLPLLLPLPLPLPLLLPLPLPLLPRMRAKPRRRT